MNLKISIYALLTLKKPQKDREAERRAESEGNEKSTRCEGGRQNKKRENVKLIKMKLSRTQGVREREKEREGER